MSHLIHAIPIHRNLFVCQEENRNQNRGAAAGKKKDAEEKYRGPDKGKGGRIIGPDGKYMPFQKGGKKGRQQQENAKKSAKSSGDSNKDKQTTDESSTKMSNIQQRRKNKNKAKVANHHRKERAQKKATGGI